MRRRWRSSSSAFNTARNSSIDHREIFVDQQLTNLQPFDASGTMLAVIQPLDR
jgi:hypothetical protein